MRSRILIALIAAVVMMGFTVASASADSHGQCNEHYGHVARTVQQEEQFLIHEGVLGQAESEVFAPAGFNHLDQTVSEWFSQRVEMSDAVKAFSGPDKGCRGGRLFPAGRRPYNKGKSMFWVLPKAYKKSTKGSPGNFSLHHTKTFSRRIVIMVEGIAMPECGNPILVEIEVEIWVEAAKKPHTPPAPKASVQQTLVCGATGLSVASPTQCNATVIEGPKTAGAGNCNSTNAGNLSGTGDTQGSCNVTNVTCMGEGSCSPKTENICTAAAAGGTATNGSNGGPALAEACKVETPPPPPKTCQEEGNCPKEPTCQEKGEVGKYPNCTPKTCQELGNCPKCQSGEEGTYPDCRKPEPPTFIDVPEPNDLQADGETDPAFCTTVQLWASDTGTLTEVSRYSGFGPHGEKHLVTFTVESLKEVCAEYAAPGEVPPGGFDEVTITVKDNQHPSLKAERVIKVKIDPEPVNPS